jgi:hypothetical protein
VTQTELPPENPGRLRPAISATYGQPLGVRCRSCERRVLVPLDKISTRRSDMTPLHTLPLKCAACGGREVELFLFVKRDEAKAWAKGLDQLAHMRPMGEHKKGRV